MLKGRAFSKLFSRYATAILKYPGVRKVAMEMNRLHSVFRHSPSPLSLRHLLGNFIHKIPGENKRGGKDKYSRESKGDSRSYVYIYI